MARNCTNAEGGNNDRPPRDNDRPPRNNDDRRPNDRPPRDQAPPKKIEQKPQEPAEDIDYWKLNTFDKCR